MLLVLLALAFDFMNGFHDAANSIATVVSTGVLKPWQAVLWAAFFNVLASAFFHLTVAATVGKGIIDPAFVDNRLIFGALIGAISWNLITWYYGIPSSSSHALIGGMIGAALAKAGTAPLLAPGIIKTAAFIIVSPMLGMLLGALLMLGVSWVCFRQTPRRVDKWFRRLQLVSSAAYSMGHGGNDAQKTMGIIWLLLIAGGRHDQGSPAELGGDQLLPRHRPRHDVRRLAHREDHGPAHHQAQAGRRLRGRNRRRHHAVHSPRIFGIPVSTTHTITGAIIGVGAAQRSSAVRWGVAGNIVIAWIVTIPASAGIAAARVVVRRPDLLTRSACYASPMIDDVPHKTPTPDECDRTRRRRGDRARSQRLARRAQRSADPRGAGDCLHATAHRAMGFPYARFPPAAVMANDRRRGAGGGVCASFFRIFVIEPLTSTIWPPQNLPEHPMRSPGISGTR